MDTSAISGLSGKLASIGAGAVAGLAAASVALGVMAIQSADAIQDMSDVTGISTNKLQAWKMSAEQAGTSLEELSGAFIKNLKNQQGALEGNKGLQEAYAKLGVSMGDLESMSPEDLFDKISNGIKENGADAVTTAALLEVMGKSAASLIPVMKEGLGGGNENDWSVSLEKNVALVAEMKDAFEGVKNIVTAIAVDVMGTFIQRIKWALDMLGLLSDKSAALPLPKYMQDEKDKKKRLAAAQDVKDAKAQEEADKKEVARVKKVGELKVQLDKAQKVAAYNALDTEGKKAQLAKEMAALAEIYNNFDLPEERRLQAQLEVLAAADKLKGLNKPEEDKPAQKPSLNQFQAIGGFKGSDAVTLSRQQLIELKLIARNTVPRTQQPRAEI